MERTDKDLRENKYYIHRHTSEGIRTTWSEEGKEQVRELKKKLGGKTHARGTEKQEWTHEDLLSK